MTMEYDVIWNGAHHGCDADLLLRPGCAKRTPSLRDREPTVELVQFVLEQQPWQTMRAIAAAIGTTTHRVNGALFLLRQRGAVQAKATHEPRAYGGYVHVYRLTSRHADGRARGTCASAAVQE